MELTTNTIINNTNNEQTQTFATKSEQISKNNEIPIEHNLPQVKKEIGDKLNRVEMRLLTKLAENCGKVVTRSDLITSSWDGRIVTGSSLNVAIKNIRDASKTTSIEGKIITVPKRGYMFIKGEVYTQDINRNTASTCSYNNDTGVNPESSVNSKSRTVSRFSNYWLSPVKFFVKRIQIFVNLMSLVLWQASFVGFLFLWWPE